MKAKLFLAVLALQVAWIVGTVAVQESRLRSPQLVHLETVPVDPRDLLRGDYVILRYKISTLDTNLFAAGFLQPLKPGTPVYVRLEKRGEFHEAVSASPEPLQPEADFPVIQGRITSRPWLPDVPGHAMEVEYGLERYYVPEGTGNPRGKLTVDAAVTRSGRAILKQVFIDGQPYAEVMKGQGK